MKYRVKIDDQTYEVEVGDLQARPVIATVDGETFEVWPESASAESPKAEAVSSQTAPASAPCPPSPIPTAPTSAAAPAAPTSGKTVPAPIPGVILSISVKVGDQVSVGQELCVLEAMKMNNSIRANRAGTIAAIQITPGDHVMHGQTLMEFTD